jgi:predicted esterase YcpF (UPF0227 family)
LTVIGSSLGGFYATWLAEKYACKAVLLNPAVKPPRDLESYVGVTTYYHSDQVFEFKAEYVAQLRALAVEKITRPERYFLLAATGDEVLDWREMVAHYPGQNRKSSRAAITALRSSLITSVWSWLFVMMRSDRA